MTLRDQSFLMTGVAAEEKVVSFPSLRRVLVQKLTKMFCRSTIVSSAPTLTVSNNGPCATFINKQMWQIASLKNPFYLQQMEACIHNQNITWYRRLTFPACTTITVPTHILQIPVSWPCSVFRRLSTSVTWTRNVRPLLWPHPRLGLVSQGMVW